MAETGKGGDPRWTIDICGRCRERVFAGGSDWKCEHCGYTLRGVESVEVVRRDDGVAKRHRGDGPSDA